MANGANIVVPVGVQLELNNVQDIINSLQKAMSNVKPDMKGYSSIVSELSKAEKRAEALASKLKQGFTTNAGLQSFTKGFEDLIAMVDTVNGKVGRINFDNLTLTADQQAKMNEFTKNIQDAKDAYNAFETSKLKEAVDASQNLQNVFKNLNLNVNTTSLDTAINSVKTKIASLQKEMDAEAKKATANETRAASRQSEIDELNKLKKLFTSNDLSKTFPEFFKDTGDFKSGGKQAFINLLKQLGIDNDTIELVKKTAGKKIQEIQQEMEKAINTRIKTKESQRNTASDNAKAARDAVDQLTAQQKEQIVAQQDLSNLQKDSGMVQARQQETNAIEQENVKIRELIKLITEAFNGNLGNNSNDLKAALDAVRASGGAAAAELENLNQRTRTVENIKRSISMWMGFNQVLRLTKTAIKNAIKDIRDLDKVMTEIAVVTNMSQKDLWNQMNTYQGIAKQYGVATTGVYQVSQIYYQQGLQTSDVMALTNETLKMAKIAGLDYSKAADYMTVAIRGFKMEMIDAQKVVDVYSNLAAKSASDTTELATAMSKTASSAAAVGSSFENTSAMIAMMVETTRESAENIGSALKSIISRYGEMKSDPSKLIDSEGEALSLNKVDTALQSVGISLHDARGEFRDFDDVILELSSKWDTLDKNSQRYIATVMAGNRQQSRFLALVSDYDRLSELTEEAANSEDAALVQTLKTMDSLETKIQNVKNAFQGFYGNLGLESVFKGTLDAITGVINSLNTMPKMFGKIPVAAIGMVANVINVIKTLGTALITFSTAQWQKISKIIEENIVEGHVNGTKRGQEAIEAEGENIRNTGAPAQNKKTKGGLWAVGQGFNILGAGLTTAALAMKDLDPVNKGVMQGFGGLSSAVGSLVSNIAMIPGTAGVILGIISGIASGLPGIIAGIDSITHAEARRIETLKETVKQSEQEATLAKAEAKNLDTAVKKLQDLSEARFDSNEAYQEWIDYKNQLVDQYPELLSMYDAEGNAVIDTAEAYRYLAEKRREAAAAEKQAKIDNLKLRKKEAEQINNILNESSVNLSGGDELGKGLKNLSNLSYYGNDLQRGKLYTASFNKGQIQLTQEDFDKLFSHEEDYFYDTYDENDNRIKDLNSGALKVNLNSIDEMLSSTNHELQQVYGDLVYENYIKPLSESSAMAETEFGAENIKKEVERISNETINGKKKTDEQIEHDVFEYYMELGKKIVGKAEDLIKINEELAQAEADLAEINSSFEDTLYKSGSADYATLVKVGSSSLMKQINQSYMKSYKEQLTNGYITEDYYKARQEEFANLLIEQYRDTGEKTWSEIEALLSHPEQYTNKATLLTDIAELFGGEIPGTIIAGINDTINNTWKLTNEDLQNNFKRNILNSNKVNKTIRRQAGRLTSVGNGSEGTEIAAQYLNDINKQWSDLVTNQKNEAVATQNAEFLADTYVDVGQLSEEANGAMANILSTAELNTREGIQKAIDQIEAYQADNDLGEEDTKLLNTILSSLKEHKDNLLLNLNTEFQQYTDSLSDAVKNVNQNYTINTSGFSELKDANDALQKINSGKLAKDQLTFDQAFRFDENLGKYVFTVQGLMEANAKAMEDINSQYEDATEQLQFSNDFIKENKTQFANLNKEQIVKGLKGISLKEDNKYSEEQRQIIGQIAKDFEESDLEWDKFISNKEKELEKIGLSAEQAKLAAENMTKEAQARNAAKAIDFSGISTGAKKVLEARQELINYFVTSIDNWEELTEEQKAEYEKQAELFADETYQKISGGGRTAAEEYRKIAEEQNIFDPDTYNQILNQPGQAAKSLLDKLNNSIGQSNIQLTQAEATLLQELGVENAETFITVDELREKAGDLFNNLQEAVEQGSISLADANKEIFENKLGDELKLEKQTNALTSLMTSDDLNISNLENFATALGATVKFADNFNVDELAGIKELDNGKKIIDPQKIQEFVTDFNEKVLGGALKEDDINNLIGSLELADKSKITDAAIQAENSIIESIASEINNIKSAGIGKKVNLTYLTNKLGADNLKSIFGDAYQDGILTVTSAVKTNMYDSLKEVRASLKAQGSNTDDLDKTLQEYTNTAMSELSEFTGKMIVSSDTASVLASRSPAFAKQLENAGKITINSIEEFVNAATLIYNQVQSQYYDGLADLTKLNSAYVNIIKGNLAKQTAGFNMLTSASKIDLTSLQNFLNVYNTKLSDYIDNMGNLKPAGVDAGLQHIGNGNYQIADWHKFIDQLNITANELSTEYIDAYVSWLQSDINVAPNAKEALMTSLIPNMEKLTYAQIGQIAKTFNMTVDAVLAFVENNGDNTFNGAALINNLEFDKNNQDFTRALANQMQTVSSNMTSAMIAFVEAGADGNRTNLDYTTLRNAISDYENAMKALGKGVVVDISTVEYALKQGGEAAVIAAQEIAQLSGQELSAQEVESFYRGIITRFTNAIDTVIAKPGEIVDKTTADLINTSGGKATALGTTGQYVVETAANLYEAYNDLLHKMAATGEATLADLNKVAGLALDNKDGQQITIDALGDAANLTYSRLGEIFTSANKLMTEELVQEWTDKGLIKALGGNKIQITDFTKFADLMEFDTGSPEYISAFKTYNESLIDMNRKAEKNILEEAQSLGDMKAGDWIDLTQFSDVLNKILEGTVYGNNGRLEITALDDLNTKLINYGAYLENGILKTVDGANIPAIIQEIANSVQQYGNLSEAELAQLADTLKEILKSYADLISGAIEGSLSNEGAQQLQQWAESVGLGKLNFQETREGLRLSTEQAYKLYQEIAKIDGLQGQIVFDNLAESLRADKGGDFSSATKTLAAVPRIQAEIKANLAEQQVLTDKLASNRATEADKARLKVLGHQEESLKRQKALYQSIAQEMAWSNMDNPDSYNFMNQSLPDVFQGPINYWNSVGEAFGAMNEAGKTGKMDIQDFYNIVGEMSNLAAATGSTIEFMGQSISGDLESAANLIEKGFNSLSNVDGKGVKVDMAKLAANLDTGATDMGKGFDSAINKMASAQVHMLDAMIKVLETIVAMEKLGEVDVDNNGLLSVGEIFDGENFTPLFDGVREYLLNSEALEPLLDDLRVHGVTLRELLDSNQDAWRNAGISEQEYANIMSAFYQAALSDNYDLDSLVSSVMNVLGGTGQVFSYYDKESGVETIIDMNGRTYSIDWNEEEDKKRIYDAFEKAGYDPKTMTDEEIRGILQQGQAGELTGEALIAYEISYGIISEYTVTNEDGSETTIWKDSYGNTYENEKDAVIGNALAKQQNQAEATSSVTEVKMGANDAKRQSFQVSGGLSYNLTVDVDGKEIYSTTASDGSLVTAKTYPEMINALLNKESLIETGGHLGLDQRSEEDILRLRRKLGVEVTPDIIFKDSSGQEFNPENDPNIKTQLGQFLNKSHESIEKSLEHTDSGTYVATLFDGSQLEVKAKDTDEAIAKLQTALDPITTSISTAITNAFTNSDTGVSEAIGNAVASAITTLNFTEDQTPEIPEISATVANIKITKIGGATYEAGEENVTPPNIDSLNATVNSLKLDAADIDVDSVGEQIQEALADLEITVPIKTPTPAGNPNNSDQQEQPESGSSTMTMNVVVNDEASSKIGEIQEKASSPVNKPINADADGSAANKIEQLNQKAGSSVSKNVNVNVNLPPIWETLDDEITKNVRIQVTGDQVPTSATGNVALAKGTSGIARAGGTLMGELGPELVVSKGRYFVVGQNGPEMVNLADDAIVFNHLQTEKLLTNGKVNSYGRPVTNERKATSLATGNANGPAMASASAALAALKQLRAMWQSLADASLKDLGGMPGGSGGGGGGGGDKTPAEIKSITQQVERWYNWMKEIEEIQTNLNKLSKEYTLLEKQHIASQTKLANLQNQQAETLRDINTRSGLIDEQKKYRSQEIARVTKEGSAFNAFYGIDEKTGRIYLKNDDAANAGFKEFLKGTKSSLGNVMVNEGKVSAGTKIDYKQSYTQKDADEDYAAWLATTEGQKASEKQKKKKKNQLKKKVGKKINKTLTTKYDIRTGADLMNELQRKDKQGNNVHDAQEQYLLLDKLGIIEKMPELMAGIDKSQEGWQETAVENFYNAIDADKEAIETLNDSIKEQEEALLDDKIAMQEINDQIREIAKPLPGITEGLEQWYNELKRIEAVQEKINILSKQNNNLQNDHIANGRNIFLNYLQQAQQLEKQQKLNEDLYNKQIKQRDNLVNKYKNLPIDYDAATGTATFSEKKYNQTVKASYTDTKKNSLGYEVDEQGRYIDNKGILRDASGTELNPNTEIFGKVQTTTINSTYKTNGKTLPQILEEITSQKANGETAYNTEQQYNILKGLGLEEFLQYDESGKQIYEDFGELSKEQMEAAVKAGISRIQGAADEINDTTSDINKLTEESLDIQSSLYEIEEAMIQNAISLENLVKDAIVQERQDAIDAKKDLRDALDKAANKTVDGLKESLDREKALYDSDSDSKELTALQSQLTLLRSAGGSLAKIRDLENKIQDKQQDMYFAERENSIDELENAAQRQIDALDTQIDIMQTSLDYQATQGLIWAEVNRKISTEGPDSLASYIVNHQKDFLNKAPTEQGQELIRIIETAQINAEARKNKEFDESITSYIGEQIKNQKNYSNRFGADFEKTLKDEAMKVYAETGNAAQAQKKVNELINSKVASLKDADRKAANKATAQKLFDSLSNPAKSAGYSINTSARDQAESMLNNGKSEAEVKKYINDQINSQKTTQDNAAKDKIFSSVTGKYGDYKTILADSNSLKKIINDTYAGTNGTVGQKTAAAEKALTNYLNNQKNTLTSKALSSFNSNIANNGNYKALTSSQQQSIKDSFLKEFYANGNADKAIANAKSSLDNSFNTNANNSYNNNLKNEKIASTLEYAEIESPMYGKAAVKEKFLELYKAASGTVEQRSAAAMDQLYKTYSSKSGAKDLLTQYKTAHKIYSIVVSSKINKYKNASDAWSQNKGNKAGTVSPGTEIPIQAISSKVRDGIYLALGTDGRYYRVRKAAYSRYTTGLPTFKKGGKIDFTGPAWVDGTKNKPEQIFNYDQMEQLRKMFLDNLTATQIGIAGLSSIMDNLPNTNSYSSINNENTGVNINQLDFHMEVEQISNDYDARRAGQAAMEEMVRIARKTGNRSISRR